MNAVIMRYFLPVGVCPGYVTFVLDLHYGMPLALFVSFSFWSICLHLSVLACFSVSVFLNVSLSPVVGELHIQWSQSGFFSGLPPCVGYVL